MARAEKQVDKEKEIKEPKVVVEEMKGKKMGGGINLTVAVYDLLGKEGEKMNLPKEIFGVSGKVELLNQALRVYLTNSKAKHGNTKTRGEIIGTTAKAYRQKGTGNARHGAQTAPIFVGGGIALGPKYRKTILEMPKKMKKAALIAALSKKALDKEVVGIAGLDQVSGKTKQMADFLSKLGRNSAIFVADKLEEKAFRSLRNLEKAKFTTADQLNVLEVIRYQSVVLTKEAVQRLEERLLAKKGSAKIDKKDESKG